MQRFSLVVYLLIACGQRSTCQREDEEKNTDTQSWNLNWFPHIPGQPDDLIDTVDGAAGLALDGNGRIQMGIASTNCDDAATNLTIDYDPNDVSHHVYFMCLDDETKYVPAYATEPFWNETTIPPAYSAIHRCMNETIEYEERLPTFGTHRPLWAQYGEYSFLPPQRWVHNLEHGTVVMLYHPCAMKKQVEKLKKLVKGCLYRHIITPSQLLMANRPLALLTWGQSLEMSVVDPELVTKFIRETALRAPEQTYNNGQYAHELLEAAQPVSGLEDSNLCPEKPAKLF